MTFLTTNIFSAFVVVLTRLDVILIEDACSDFAFMLL
jgi:hypothetical protein